MAQKNLQVRLDTGLHQRAEKVFRKIGMDTPTAIRVFFAKVADVGGIPFLLESSDDVYTPQQLRKIDRLAAQSKSGKGVSASFSSIDDLMKDLRR